MFEVPVSEEPKKDNTQTCSDNSPKDSPNDSPNDSPKDSQKSPDRLPDVPQIPEVPQVPAVPDVKMCHVPRVPDVPHVPHVPERKEHKKHSKKPDTECNNGEQKNYTNMGDFMKDTLRYHMGEEFEDYSISEESKKKLYDMFCAMDMYVT